MSQEPEMFAVIRSWQASGLSKAEFIRRNDLSTNIFYYWFRKYSERVPASPAFVQVTHDQPVAAAEREPRLRVELPDGTTVLVY